MYIYNGVQCFPLNFARLWAHGDPMGYILWFTLCFVNEEKKQIIVSYCLLFQTALWDHFSLLLFFLFMILLGKKSCFFFTFHSTCYF